LHNRFLNERTARDIDRRVAKILKDLGDPEPPIRLEVVRELLRLDLAYYSSSDERVIAETIHRLTVGGKQILSRPALLLEALQKWDLKALWVPDRKRILIDAELPTVKKRWGEAHEVGHSLLPWHEIAVHGDSSQTLSLTCEQQVEAEANFVASRLLFLQDKFTSRLHDSPLSFDAVRSLSKDFGNSMTSTLWRTVKVANSPVFGLVSQHPKEKHGEEPIRYFVRSRSFLEQFGGVTGMYVLLSLRGICRGSRGPIGTGEIIVCDVNGDDHLFRVESFFNSYDALTLGTYASPRVTQFAV
jgi:Zn-dependent peptidase ImmA (M78 family)